MWLWSNKDRREYERHVRTADFEYCRQFERDLAVRHSADKQYEVAGHCQLCHVDVDFLVDRQAGAKELDGVWFPNWRERLVCPSCGMNSRQRAILSIAAQAIRSLPKTPRPVVYLMEQVSPVYQWVAQAFPEIDCIGGEYLGPDVIPGTVRGGIRHEDAERLSFADGSIDLIITNDVLEHVSKPERAIAEIARVLKPGGELFMTIPFHAQDDQNVQRAELSGGRIHHILPPVYHGNPISSKGSLVFTDFGWEILTLLKKSGLQDPRFNLYWSPGYGHLGVGDGYFCATKRRRLAQALVAGAEK
jgi:hypothetical protein